MLERSTGNGRSKYSPKIVPIEQRLSTNAFLSVWRKWWWSRTECLLSIWYKNFLLIVASILCVFANKKGLMFLFSLLVDIRKGRTDYEFSFLDNSPCDEQLTEGQGTSKLVRWFFDQRDRVCSTFWFKGQKGTGNNFLSRADCERSCPVFLDPCPSTGTGITKKFGDVRFCSPQGQLGSSGCPQGQWCHIGADPESTICCSNGMFQKL